VLALLFTILIFPAVSAAAPEGLYNDFFFVLALFAKEIFVGMVIGLSAAMVFHAFEAAGQVIDAQRGASMAQVFSPQSGHQVTIFAQFMLQFGIVLFLVLGGHRLFLHALFESFQVIPVYEFLNTGPNFVGLMELFISITGQVLYIGAQLAAPIIISIFVVDLILGVMNRISPAINVLTLGFTIRGVTGVLIFFLCLGVSAHQMGLLSMTTVDSVRRAIQFLAV